MSANPLSYVDPQGAELVGAIFGGIAGAVGSYISSGGDWTATFVGGAVGFGVGLINPFSVFYSNVTASLVGQVIGNKLACKDPLDVDLVQAGAAGVGGVIGRGVGKYLTSDARSLLGPARPWVNRLGQSLAQGSLGGIFEGGAHPPAPAESNRCGCQK